MIKRPMTKSRKNTLYWYNTSRPLYHAMIWSKYWWYRSLIFSINISLSWSLRKQHHLVLLFWNQVYFSRTTFYWVQEGHLSPDPPPGNASFNQNSVICPNQPPWRLVFAINEADRDQIWINTSSCTTNKRQVIIGAIEKFAKRTGGGNFSQAAARAGNKNTPGNKRISLLNSRATANRHNKRFDRVRQGDYCIAAFPAAVYFNHRQGVEHPLRKLHLFPGIAKIFHKRG